MALETTKTLTSPLGFLPRPPIGEVYFTGGSMEEWKKIDGVNGEYYISNMGNVVSNNRCKSILMKLVTTPRGYKRVSFGQGYRTISKAVHRLVASAFCKGFKPGLQVNHKDGDKQNNNASNLEWVTNMENRIHGKKMRLFPSGEMHHAHKLTDHNVRKIIEISKTTRLSCLEISMLFGVCDDTIRNVLTGKTWKHISKHTKEGGV